MSVSDTEITLEFPKVLKYVSAYAQTDVGKLLINDLRPLHNLATIALEGKCATEAKEILVRSNYPPIEYLPDINEPLRIAKIDGAVLEVKQIMSILSLAQISRNLVRFLSDNIVLAPELKLKGNHLFSDKVLEHHITSLITESGELKDSASKLLKEIRSDIRSKNEELRRLVNRLVKDLSEKDLVREEYITLREGRVVIPVKSEHKRHIKGFIHSESATGQTVYIEPEETLNLNNEIVSLSFAEKREIERILRELTKRIAEHSDTLLNSLLIVAELDKYFAIAKYSIETRGSFPTLDDSKPLLISDARHPVLLKKLTREGTVPLNLKIAGNKIIILTGPNAGGKTVVLKNVGLLSIMVQCGLHIPASPDSNFHIFNHIFVDIGDKQSIEDDLSTFSSHLSNLYNILEQADNHSLVLLDELGTGTEPAAGSALATAIISRLKEKGVTLLAATHLGALKLLANETEGIENASMEFNTIELKPTYTFRQGIPGSSYAFEIAKRIGFDNDLLKLASAHLNPEQEKFDKSLVDMENKSRILEEKLRTAEINETKLRGLISLYNERITKLDREKKLILKHSREEGEKFLNEAKHSINAIIKEIRESGASKQAIKNANVTLHNILAEGKTLHKEEPVPSAEVQNLKVGDTVRIKGSNSTGIIEEFLRNGEMAHITSGTIRLKVKVSELELTAPEKKKPAFSEYSLITEAQYGFRLDIRGKKPEETELEIIKFVDTAYSSSRDRIEILHGKGTGVLKKLVKEILDSHPGVKSYHFAPVEYGGEGVTIVELK